MEAWSMSIPRHLDKEEPETRWQNSETLAPEASGEPEPKIFFTRAASYRLDSKGDAHSKCHCDFGHP